MKTITIKGAKREHLGKVSTKALRRQNRVPCVLYGGKQVIHFSAEEKAFKNLVYTPDVHTVSLDLDDKNTYNTILQDIHFHPVSDQILHIDFYELDEEKLVSIDIPVKTEGVSPGVLKGGVLRVGNRKLKVRALPKNLPDYITVDISKLEIGDKLYITALETQDYVFLHPDNTVVAQVRTARTAIVTEDEETEDLGDETAVTEESKSEASS